MMNPVDGSALLAIQQRNDYSVFLDSISSGQVLDVIEADSFLYWSFQFVALIGSGFDLPGERSAPLSIVRKVLIVLTRPRWLECYRTELKPKLEVILTHFCLELIHELLMTYREIRLTVKRRNRPCERRPKINKHRSKQTTGWGIRTPAMSISIWHQAPLKDSDYSSNRTGRRSSYL